MNPKRKSNFEILDEWKQQNAQESSDEEDADIIASNMTRYIRTGRVPNPYGIPKRIKRMPTWWLAI